MRFRRHLIFFLFFGVFLGVLFFSFLPHGAPFSNPYSWPSGPEELQGILNPKAGSFRSPNLNPNELTTQFQNPPSNYRSMPLWVWNDELEWPRLQEQLRQFKNQGFGGVFVHPRPGLMTEYLGEKWFDLWHRAIQEGEKLGLSINIYDENSYPSGFAGGHVPALAPDTATQFVIFTQPSSISEIPWKSAETAAVMAVWKNEAGEIKKARRVYRPEDFKAGEFPLLFSLRRAGGNPWTAGFPYVDLINPETSQMFLRTTFEAYKNRFAADFGKTIKWVFDDEPLLATAGAYDSGEKALPLSRYILSEFQKRCGYDLADFLPLLYWDIDEFTKVRFDFWQTLHDLWKENYLRPLYFWCDRNNLQFTGHWMEHEWPYPWISPADASLYAYEHVPGIDMLEGTNLRLQGKDPHMLFTIKQVASVAHQLNRRAFCEAYGVAGWDSTFEHYKRFGDWLMVHGINFMNQHLSFSTIRGARKRDHPQSFSDVAPWWPYYRYHADHLARTCFMLSQGQPRNRILVLQPTTTGFLWARRGSETPELEKIRSDFSSLVQTLADNQIDFDLGDEYILEWFGKSKGNQLQVGNASYDLVIWPENMINIRHQTIPLLHNFLSSGGSIISIGELAHFVDGRRDSTIPDWPKVFPKKWTQVSDRQLLLHELRHLVPSRAYFNNPKNSVGICERFLENGDRIVFLANSGQEKIQEEITVVGAGSVDFWDTVDGEIKKIAVHSQNGKIQFPVELEAAGSSLYVTHIKEDTYNKNIRVQSPHPSETIKANWKILPDTENILVLDYCDLKLNGLNFNDINTWDANWKVWQFHGFDRPAWDNAVQYKTRVFDRNHFSDESGFEVKFDFYIEELNGLNKLDLAIESSELYTILVNGDPISFSDGIQWLDPHIKKVSIRNRIKTGNNEVKIVAKPFDVRMELENIYLLGDFILNPKSRGFNITPLKDNFQFGSWANQGYPFYSGIVRYETELILPEKKDVFIKLFNLKGALAEVLLDNKSSAILAWPPFETNFNTGIGGKHFLTIRVVPTPRNLFGPFHNPAKLRMRAWPAAWADFPVHQPAGSNYDFIDNGLDVEPNIIIK
jgi:hypothetical protein